MWVGDAEQAGAGSAPSPRDLPAGRGGKSKGGDSVSEGDDGKCGVMLGRFGWRGGFA